ncbi:hypothetical protein K488DRAFT_89388 [Vararia minispora EC-137]|uniref:Uncharacterized protein n=1 Tax=Vararia minispora EC-137 TaxID=1314806 RepID=A0ACB8QAG7_9AGAM|nr:hypothetical protein K488DRAFT_89388 [Vararia minispora EC-137]
MPGGSAGCLARLSLFSLSVTLILRCIAAEYLSGDYALEQHPSLRTLRARDLSRLPRPLRDNAGCNLKTDAALGVTKT